MPSGTREAAGLGARVEWSSWYSLGAILVVAAYSVMDRATFSLLAEPMRLDLGLSDFDLGLLQGVGLALCAALAAYPVAWLADRFDRRAVMAGCVVVWSIAVVGCGLATGFPMLLAATAVVGVGEAGLSNTAYALVPELFPGEALQLGNSVVAVGGRLSSAVGLAACGALIAFVGRVQPGLPPFLAALPLWRLSFFAAVCGLPIAVALLLTLPRKVGRPAQAARPAVGGQGGEAADLRPYLRRHARLLAGFFGAASVAMLGAASMGVWLPVIASRYFHVDPARLGALFGALTLGAGAIGLGVGVLAARGLERRGGPLVPFLLVAVPNLVMIPAIVLMAFTTDEVAFFGLWAFASVAAQVQSQFFPTILQRATPPWLRARMFALLFVALTVAGALSTPLSGWVSDQLAGFDRPLILATSLLAPGLLLVSSFLFWWASKGYAAALRESGG